MIQFSNLIRARPSCVIALAFALQGAPAARAQAWSFFLECGKFPDKEQASQRMEHSNSSAFPFSFDATRIRAGIYGMSLSSEAFAPPTRRSVREFLSKHRAALIASRNSFTRLGELNKVLPRELKRLCPTIVRDRDIVVYLRCGFEDRRGYEIGAP